MGYKHTSFYPFRPDTTMSDQDVVGSASYMDFLLDEGSPRINELGFML